MLNVAVFFGGKSVEHDVSVVTAQQLIQNADKTKYNIIPVYITRDGDWFSGEKLCDIKAFENFDKGAQDVTRVYIPANTKVKQLYRYNEKKGLFAKSSSSFYAKIDVAILSMHGLNGEDGTLQGVLELANIPYTSSGVLGSAAGMDKILMKSAFIGANLPVLPYIFFDRNEFFASKEKFITESEEKLGYPVFVKPSNLGSSIGISKAHNKEELISAVETAAAYDRRILIEKGIDSPKEINCSGLGFGGDIKTSVCEMPATNEEFLTFGEKYLNGEKHQASMESLSRRIPAPIPDEMTLHIQQMTREIFRLLDCKGVVRIDYIASSDLSELYVNEINTIPGSFAFYLWEPLGISYPNLIDELINFAITAAEDKRKNNFAFDSEIIAKFASGSRQGAKSGKLGFGKSGKI